MKTNPLFSIFSLLIFILLTSQILRAQKPSYSIKAYENGTYLGDINITLFRAIAPLHVHNFDSLVGESYYDTTAFHRVVPGFVIQGGDPNSRHGSPITWGQGQPSQPTVPAEFNGLPHLRGALSAARDTDINSASSQFFICHDDATSLDWNYTAYGWVTSGIEIVDTIALRPADGSERPWQKIEMFITKIDEDSSSPSHIQILTPLPGTEGLVGSISMSWTGSGDHVLYEYEIATDSLFTDIVKTDQVHVPDGVFTGVDFITTYYMRVRATNGGYWTPWDSTHFISATGPPILSSPSNSQTFNVDTIDFGWMEPWRGSDHYRFQLSTSDSFPASDLLLDTTGVNSTDLMAILDSPGLYYWRVQSASASSPGAWSQSRSFSWEAPLSNSQPVAATTDLNFAEIHLKHIDADQLRLSWMAKEMGQTKISLLDLRGRNLLESEIRGKIGFNSIEFPWQSPSGIFLIRLERANHFGIKKAIIR